VARFDSYRGFLCGREAATRVRHLALVGQVDPVALEDVLHLQLELLLVGEDPAVGAVDAGRGIVDDGVGEHGLQVLQRVGHGRPPGDSRSAVSDTVASARAGHPTA
jgi:hypothetical protein